MPFSEEEKEETYGFKVGKYLFCNVLSIVVFMSIVIGALCWTIILVEGIALLSLHGFIIKGNFVHAGGALFILIFAILFPLNYMLNRSDRYFSRWKREIYHEEERKQMNKEVKHE